eukprot:TRINITY_DN4542_c0_g1_i1.p1 TRINITY_DN4542_c0_g1~~TRINITY_DN4542_c0_g1_i1.p1  ORF type:complete len:263 (+),score=33.72 TRINITY_DN4542_c0_g1_i1:143-931(+)
MEESKISLTDYEKQLFKELLEIVSVKKLSTTLRVAGGWVRDKIMGKESADIDITLDNLSGKEFAELIKESIPGTRGFGVIKKNAEKAKHLETATIKIHDRWVDISNLRTEQCVDEEKKVGTPVEDALLRDLTINTLFYNINEDKVEDFTEHGIEDIHNKVIRTPLEPAKTFADDPLRVLRTIRFAVRFNFSIHPDVAAAIQSKVILVAIVCTCVGNARRKGGERENNEGICFDARRRKWQCGNRNAIQVRNAALLHEAAREF